MLQYSLKKKYSILLLLVGNKNIQIAVKRAFTATDFPLITYSIYQIYLNMRSFGRKMSCFE